MSDSRTRTSPSPWPAPSSLKYLGPHTDVEPIDVTLVLRRRGGAAPRAASWPSAPRLAPRAHFAQDHGADPADIESLRRFARAHGLTELGCDPARRVLHLRGTPGALQRAFRVTLGQYQFEDGRGPFVGTGHAPQLPPAVLAVLGLDRRPVAQVRSRRPRTTPALTYTPLQLGGLYAFPAGSDGSGESVAIIELGGGFRERDLTQYFSSLGIARMPAVTAVPVAGGANTPGGEADGEVMLDIEVVGALAPGANIVVYFAPNTDQGFYEAISQAAHDNTHKPAVMSVSWGGTEDGWTAPARDAMQSALEDAAALAVTVTVAAGDSGSSDGASDGQPHVDFPASSPYVLACGGTRLTAKGSAIVSEVVWNDSAADEGATGGGVSTVFALPEWQAASQVPKSPSGSRGRGVPDVSGNADPLTGYQILLDGQSQVIGGTSAVAPLWAALIARCNQKLGGPLGAPHSAFYQIGSKAFRDITQGNNGAYQAGPGWDACTGLGSPDGAALLAALAALK